MIRVLFLLCLSVLCSVAHAHKASDSYLRLQVTEDTMSGQWDIALRDLDEVFDVDADHDGAITWGEVRQRQVQISNYAISRLQIHANEQACTTAVSDLLIDQHSDGAYVVLPLHISCSSAPLPVLNIDYSLLFDVDAQHRGLLRLEYPQQIISAIFSPEQTSQRFEPGTSTSLRQWLGYISTGVEHIWNGYDHILFLIALLLPSVLRRVQGQWHAISHFSEALRDTIKIVTAFTLAHSVTLSLAVLDIVTLPNRWVESVIAISVVLAALNNLYPLFHGRRMWVAFAFGLVHGFGFAGALSDLGLTQSAIFLPLLSFNLGVEFGQLTVVAVFLPLAYLLRDSWLYRSVVLRVGSAAAAMLALVWFVERAALMQIT